MSQQQESLATILKIPPATFGMRAWAATIDGFIINVASLLFMVLLTIIVGIANGTPAAEILRPMRNLGLGEIAILNLFIGWLYYGRNESGPRQATVGKRVARIFVTDLLGNRVTFGTATQRFAARYFSGTILGIGFLMAAWDPKGQALHDRLAKCLVVQGRVQGEK